MSFTPHTIDPTTDLELVREVPVAPELVWRAWTEPELIVQWFTPKPWVTTEAEVDLRPGGIFRTAMKGPDDAEKGGFELEDHGHDHADADDDHGGSGCVLEVIPNERFVWTAALGPGFRPQASDMPFTAILELAPTPSGGTRYRAIAMHQEPEAAKKHDEMGFHQGWGASLDQLVELMSSLA